MGNGRNDEVGVQIYEIIKGANISSVSNLHTREYYHQHGRVTYKNEHLRHLQWLVSGISVI